MLRTLISTVAIAAILGACAARPRCAPVASDNAAVAASPADTLQALRQSAATHGSVRVIIRLARREPGARTAALAEAQNIFRSYGIEAAPLGGTLPFVVVELTEVQLVDALYYHWAFASWSEDRVMEMSLSDSAPLVQAPRLWELGGRGAGQAVAILDTGVDAAHPFLSGRVNAEACFSTTSGQSRSVCPNGEASQIGPGAARPCQITGCLHGTHVAGIAAGRGESFSGIAPDANIIAVQVFSRFGQSTGAFTSDIIRGLDFVLQQNASQRVAAVNLSLGGGRERGFCDTEPMKMVVDQLRSAGVATVIASGNDGLRDSVSFPGCISSAVTIGATDKRDRIASFSNCGPQTDLHAPGVAITSSVPGRGFQALSGTSMATPHVVGAFAALRSRFPNANVTQLELALEATGPVGSGRPRIALFDANTRLGSTP